MAAPLLGLVLLGAGCGERIGEKLDEQVEVVKDSASGTIESGVDSAVDKVQEEIAEKAIEKELEKQGEDGEVDVDGRSVEIKTGAGQFAVGEEIELPSDFDDKIPVYGSAKVTTASANKEDKEYSASMNTDDSYGDVVNYYKSELEKNGWSLDENNTVELGGTGLTTMKATGNGLELNVSVTNGISLGEGETQIVLSATAL